VTLAPTPVRAASTFGGFENVLGAAEVDLDRGSVEIVARGEVGVDLELAALLEGEVLEVARAAAARIAPLERLESIVIGAGPRLHVVVPSRRSRRRFLFLLLTRESTALGLLLHRLEEPIAS
jgi:hypothetical protein